MRYRPIYTFDLPTIDVSGRKVLISFPEVFSVDYQRHSWDIYSIDYKIGRVMYGPSSR